MSFSSRIVTPPNAEPITRAEAKAHLRVEHTADDTLIDTLIVAARQACEGKLQRTLITTVYEAVFDGFLPVLPLRRPPVASVASIQYRDTAGNFQTLDAGNYSVALTYSPAFVEPAFGKCWPCTAKAKDAVKIQYTAGYGVDSTFVPKAIKQWMLLHIADMYENRTSTVQNTLVHAPWADGLLDPYKVIEL